MFSDFHKREFRRLLKQEQRSTSFMIAECKLLFHKDAPIRLPEIEMLATVRRWWKGGEEHALWHYWEPTDGDRLCKRAVCIYDNSKCTQPLTQQFCCFQLSPVPASHSREIIKLSWVLCPCWNIATCLSFEMRTSRRVFLSKTSTKHCL